MPLGRPKLELDEEQLLNLARIQCTYEEMAAVMNCSIDTLRDNYSHVIHKGREQGKMSLRRELWKLVQRGNLGACIWMSKNYLGMSDKAELNTTNTVIVEQTKQMVELPTEQLIEIAKEEIKKLEPPSE